MERDWTEVTTHDFGLEDVGNHVPLLCVGWQYWRTKHHLIIIIYYGVFSFPLQVASCNLQVASCKLQFANCKLHGYENFFFIVNAISYFIPILINNQ